MGLLDDEELLRRPAFGVFPQMQPRRRLQDREASANVPLDVTRGRLAGLLGLLPDTLNFMGRSPMPTEMFGDTQYEPAPQMPYGSEYYLQNLPLKPTSRIGEVAGQAGAFVPLNPMPAARAVAAGARALGPTAVGMGERYLQSKGLMPGVVEGESAGMLGGPIKPQAPVSPIGFYSATEQAALALPRKSGTGDAFLNDLMKGQDVKKDELSWMGLDDYLKGKPNVTRQEVQDYIAGNRVDVQEVRLGDKEVKFPSTIGLMKREEVLNSYQPKLDALYAEDANYANLTPQRYEELGQEIRALERQRDIEADAAYVMPSFKPAPTKYERYQLPGGENYREILLTLPKSQPKVVPLEGGGGRWGVQMPDGTISSRYYDWDDAAQALRFDAQKAGVTYTSSHFNEPNILAHMRVNDRIDADGKKMLLIEELQSDWHQGGREKGYNTPQQKASEQEKLNSILTERQNLLEEQKRLEELALPYTSQGKDAPSEIVGQWSTVSNRLQNLQTEQNRLGRTFDTGVPDAPFKGTWHQLALKRALKYAADNGYDRVGLTTGSQQAERYDLSKQISKIYYSPPDSKQANKFGTVFKAFDSRGHEIINKAVTPEELPGIVGKEVAKKLLDAKGNEMGVKALDGIDLQVGGEGMKKYYDEIYPAFLEKQGKKYNAKTGETVIKTGQRIQLFGVGKLKTGMEPVRYIDISPEMRGGVKKGQPLFTAAPIGGIGLGAGTQDNEMPDAVRQYMANPASGLLQDEDERKKLGGLLFR